MKSIPTTANPACAHLGMSRTSGKQLGITDHIAQSILDILTTPIGSRIQRRAYGSRFFSLIDSAMNEAGRLRLTAALVDAINKWEPRVKITYAVTSVNKDGKTVLDYHYQLRGDTTTYTATTLLSKK